MSVLRTAGAAAGLLLALTVAPPVADAGPVGDSGPDRIDLPNGWRPEGITTDRRKLYIGSLADGAIWVADPRTGDGEVLAAGAPGRMAVGVDHDRRRDVLWVAGGTTGEVRAQDADTGAVLATYSFPSPDGVDRFLNDVTVTHDAVYVTDSRHAELAVIPFDGRALPAPDAAEVLPLTGDLVMRPGNNLNGIVSRSGHRLVAVQTNTGALLRIDPRTGETDEIELDGEPLLNGDGLELARGRLWVLRNVDNLLVEVRLHHGTSRATVLDAVTDEGFDVPSTGAVVRHSLYAVNARFGPTPTPETAYWITRIDLR
jgi:hypothetical protein